MGKRTLRQRIYGYFHPSRTERPTKVAVALSCLGSAAGLAIMGSGLWPGRLDWILVALGAWQFLAWLPAVIVDLRAYRHFPPNPMHELQKRIKEACQNLLAGRDEVIAASDQAGYLLRIGTRHHFWKYLLISKVAKSDVDEVLLSADREGFVVNKVYALITRPEFSANILEILQPQRLRDTEDGPVFVEQTAPSKLSAWQINKLMRSGALYAAKEDLEALLADLSAARPTMPE